MTIALLYCRLDGEADPGRSATFDAQEQVLIADAERRGFSYKVIRESPSKGAGTQDRLAEALDLLDEHRADVLMTTRLDWLGSDPEGVTSIVRRSAARGWGLIIAGETLGPGPASLRFQEHLDELARSQQHRRRTREGIQRRKGEGATFGRVVDDKFLVTYRRVLSMAEDEVSMNEIARILNADGTPTARGGMWHASTVRAILTSETAKRLA